MTFYTYVLLDPTAAEFRLYGDIPFLYRPFYVGKARSWVTRLSYHKNCDDWSSKKVQILNHLRWNGYAPIVKTFPFKSEKEAFDFEVYLISVIGRLDKENGPLTNLSAGGEGVQSGSFTSARRRKRSKALKRYWSRFSAEERREMRSYARAPRKCFSDPQGLERTAESRTIGIAKAIRTKANFSPERKALMSKRLSVSVSAALSARTKEEKQKTAELKRKKNLRRARKVLKKLLRQQNTGVTLIGPYIRSTVRASFHCSSHGVFTRCPGLVKSSIVHNGFNGCPRCAVKEGIRRAA